MQRMQEQLWTLAGAPNAKAEDVGSKIEIEIEKDIGVEVDEV